MKLYKHFKDGSKEECEYSTKRSNFLLENRPYKKGAKYATFSKVVAEKPKKTETPKETDEKPEEKTEVIKPNIEVLENMEVGALRTEYSRVLGKKAPNNWGKQALINKILKD